MVKLFVCGDIVAKRPENLQLSSAISALMKDCNMAVCNFEAPIANNYQATVKSGPTLFQSTEVPACLEHLGFNIILAGNNHIMDYGPQGCLDTLSSFNNAVVVGAGKAEDAYKVKVQDVNGLKVGFLSGCQYEFGITRYNTDEVGVAWISSPEIIDIIRQAKAGLDYLIVFPHAGLEDYDAPLPGWRELYKIFVDNGADAVIAGHTHCPQGYEIYKGAPIIYSLGNFYFDALLGDAHWWDGLAVVLTLDNGVTLSVYNTIFKEGLVDVNESDRIKEHNKYLQHLIDDEEAYNTYIDEACKKAYPLCQYGLLRGMCGTSRGLEIKKRLRLFAHRLLNHYDIATYLNTVRCETHRWVIERYLNIKLKEKYERK